MKKKSESDLAGNSVKGYLFTHLFIIQLVFLLLHLINYDVFSNAWNGKGRCTTLCRF